MKIRMATLGIAAGLVATMGCSVAGAVEDGPISDSPVELVLGRLLPEEGGAPDADPGPLKRPFGVDFTPEGTMIIVELEGGRVHAMDPDGSFRTIAGDGSTGYEGDGGPSRTATFDGMHNVAVTPDGAILIADSWNHCVRRIDPADGTITTIAGTGAPGDSGDGGPATEATFNFIMCITLDATGNRLDLADLNNRRVRSVDLASGIVSAEAGNGQRGVPPDGAKATESPLVDPRAVASDSKGRLYILERSGHALRVVDPDGTIRTVAGTGVAGFRDGPAQNAQLNGPKHLAIGPDDSVYIADDENAAIRRYDPETETITTVLGRGQGSPTILLLHPHGVCVEGDQLYVVDTGHDRIFRMPLPVQPEGQ
jgi:sugar lactone lactonase YvrE